MSLESNKTKWFAGLLIAGGLCLAIALYFILKPAALPPEQLKLGQADLISGKAYLLRYGLEQRQSFESRTLLFSLDSVETMDLAEVVLSFDSGYRIKLYENTLVTLEKQQEKILLIIKRGDLKVEKFGREADLQIAKNGERIDASDYNSSPLAIIPATPPTTTLPELKESNTAPSEQEIIAILSVQKNYFYKCYTQLLQKNSQAKGEVGISFILHKTGKISGAIVARSQIEDATFKSCLLGVLNRVEFREFLGQDISAYFPLRFE